MLFILTAADVNILISRLDVLTSGLITLFAK